MIYVKGADLKADWDEIDFAGNVQGGASAKEVNTGDWRINIPTFHEEKCTQCLLCFPVCADYAIPVVDGKRLDFDYHHCKGCGVCYKVCPPKFQAITWEKEDK